MGLKEIFQTPDIDVGVNKCRMTPGGMLLDVRSKIEYDGGHVPGARNVPFPEVKEKVEKVLRDKEAPIFVYCTRGVYAQKAIKVMRKLGYKQLENIGGFRFYNGKVERK